MDYTFLWFLRVPKKHLREEHSWYKFVLLICLAGGFVYSPIKDFTLVNLCVLYITGALVGFAWEKMLTKDNIEPKVVAGLILLEAIQNVLWGIIAFLILNGLLR